METKNLHVVTGAFGYSGKYIARRLLDAGHRVRTLTNSPNRPNPFGGAVEVRPFDFERPEEFVESLRGVEVLYNTYWVRFNHPLFSHSQAVENTLTLFRAAAAAGVGRVVHVSITNPSLDSPLEYFRGKAELEQALIGSGMSYAILRPAVLFGDEDILVNNIAWSLRRFLAIPIFGDGLYRLQPIYVDDLAELAVAAGAATDNRIIDAIGPETFTYRELVATIGRLIGKPRLLVCVPPSLGYLACTVLGKLIGDVILTREEIKGLMSDLLCVDSPSAGHTRLTDWVRKNADYMGQCYSSELFRRKNRKIGYK